MILRLKALAAVVAATFVSFGLDAAPNIFWPAEARPKLEVVSRPEIVDGVPVSVTEFVSSDLRIRTDSSGGWIGGGESGGRYSLRLNHYSSPDVRLSLAEFRKGEFLPDLGDSFWSAYLDGLRQLHGASLIELTEGAKADGNGDIFLFGKPYREVFYTTRASPDQPATGHREIFVLAGGKLLAFVVQAPAAALPKLTLPIDRFLSRLELMN